MELFGGAGRMPFVGVQRVVTVVGRCQPSWDDGTVEFCPNKHGQVSVMTAEEKFQWDMIVMVQRYRGHNLHEKNSNSIILSYFSVRTEDIS
ncbi:hypothetical protein AVEN_196556-1 [Araneus ventricosus]|uniref:Uncharacterized protein n=1 Tax=Araneus ventricosus TaxID=182803 RepID=A0A4Y2IQF6_ARAVE|nr:hypothetical protein AVEN_196556-1 [Araneus ventricosus]